MITETKRTCHVRCEYGALNAKTFCGTKTSFKRPDVDISIRNTMNSPSYN